MDVSANAHVVGEVPAVVIGIFVNYDVVAVPAPVIAVSVVGGGDAEIEAAEPEAIPISAREMPDMLAAEAAGEVSVLPGMDLRSRSRIDERN
jgi:hypothetical protein